MIKPHGIIPPIITPLHENGDVNYEMLKELIDHLISEGVHGIFPLGASGEFYCFDNETNRKILETCKEAVAGRVPLYAGANHITTRGVIEQIKIYEEVGGIDAVSVLTPMFISQTQDELYRFYEEIANSTKLPIIIYSNPPKTNITLTPATCVKLANIENIIAIKDSSGDMTTAAEYIRLTKDIENFSVLMGRDTIIYPGLCCGAAGAIASCANVAPKIAVDIYNKYMEGDHKGSLEAQFAFAPIRIACAMGSFPAVIKEGLVMQGFNVGKCMSPIQELTSDEKAKLRAVLVEVGLIQ